MLQVYLIKLWIRIAIFLVTAVLYIGDRDSIYRLIMTPVRQGINFMHILWFLFMFMMLAHLFPKGNKTMALMKTMEKEYEPVLNYSEPELHNYLKDQNERAAVVMGVWIAFNSIFGVLYLQYFIFYAIIFVFYFSVPFRRLL